MTKNSNNPSQLIVLSAIGTDRAGVVNDLSGVILDCGGNIEESRMTALGAEFAVVMLVSGNWATVNKLEKTLEKLCADKPLQVSIRKTDQRGDVEESMPYGIDVVSLDEPGIVFHISSFFASKNVEISDLSTRRYSAAHTGSQMFAVQATINIPGSVSISRIRDEFFELCDQHNLDAIIEPIKQ